MRAGQQNRHESIHMYLWYGVKITTEQSKALLNAYVPTTTIKNDKLNDPPTTIQTDPSQSRRSGPVRSGVVED